MLKLGKSLLMASTALFALATCVSVGVAQEASRAVGFIRCMQYQGRYAISFPVTRTGQPHIHTDAIEKSADAEIDGTRFCVTCQDLRDAGRAEKLFDDLEAYAQQANHAKIVRQAAIALGSFPGREVELESDNGWQRICRDYLVGNRLYRIAVEPLHQKLNRELSKEFLDSFTLLDGNAPLPVPAPSADPVPPTPSVVAAPSPGPSAVPAPSPVPAPPAVPAPSADTPSVPKPPQAPQQTPASAVHKRYVNPQGRYFIGFSETPSKSERSAPNGSVLHQEAMEQQGVAYVVTYGDLPAAELERAGVPLDGTAAFYSAWKDDVIGQMHATLKNESYVRVAGRAAYEAEFVVPDGTHLIARVVLIRGRGFRVAVGGAGITAATRRVRQFFDSFGIIE